VADPGEGVLFRDNSLKNLNQILKNNKTK